MPLLQTIEEKPKLNYINPDYVSDEEEKEEEEPIDPELGSDIRFADLLERNNLWENNLR